MCPLGLAALRADSAVGQASPYQGGYPSGLGFFAFLPCVPRVALRSLVVHQFPDFLGDRFAGWEGRIVCALFLR